MFAAVLPLLSIKMPFCPSLSSSFLSWIPTCFHQSLHVNIHLFSILLVNILNSAEVQLPSRSTLLPWVQSQLLFPCPTSLVWFSSLYGARGQSHSQKLLWWRACTKLLSFFVQCCSKENQILITNWWKVVFDSMILMLCYSWFWFSLWYHRLYF